MGTLSRFFFGLEKLPRDCIAVGGIHGSQKIEKLLSLFVSARKLKHPATCPHLVTHERRSAIILFNIFSAARSLSVVRVLKDGGCERIFFVGWAGTNKNIPVGTYILPEKVRCLDGVTLIANPRIKYAYPDPELFKEVKQLFDKNKVKYELGTTISEPAVWHAIPNVEKEAKNALAADLELSALLYFSKKVGIKSVGILIITDTPKDPLIKFMMKRLVDKRYRRLMRALKLIRELI